MSLTPPLRLADLKTGEQAEIVYIDAPEGVQDFLTAEGLQPGLHLDVLAVGSNGAMLINIGERQSTLAASIAAEILIKKVSTAMADRPQVLHEVPE